MPNHNDSNAQLFFDWANCIANVDPATRQQVGAKSPAVRQRTKQRRLRNFHQMLARGAPAGAAGQHTANPEGAI
jgi:hypothetical protein